VVQTALAGWTDSTDQATFPGGNVASAHTGRFSLVHSASVAYTAKQSQQISGLPVGTYSLSAWAMSSGGQKSCAIYARASTGKEFDLSAASAISGWKQFSASGIQVSDGVLEVGVRSVANAGNWVRVDDISLVQDASTGLVLPDNTRGPGFSSRIQYSGSRFALEPGSQADVYELSGKWRGRIAGTGTSLRLADLGYGEAFYLLRVRSRAALVP